MPNMTRFDAFEKVAPYINRGKSMKPGKVSREDARKILGSAVATQLDRTARKRPDSNSFYPVDVIETLMEVSHDEPRD